MGHSMFPIFTQLSLSDTSPPHAAATARHLSLLSHPDAQTDTRAPTQSAAPSPFLPSPFPILHSLSVPIRAIRGLNQKSEIGDRRSEIQNEQCPWHRFFPSLSARTDVRGYGVLPSRRGDAALTTSIRVDSRALAVNAFGESPYPCPSV